MIRQLHPLLVGLIAALATVPALAAPQQARSKDAGTIRQIVLEEVTDAWDRKYMLVLRSDGTANEFSWPGAEQVVRYGLFSKQDFDRLTNLLESQAPLSPELPEFDELHKRNTGNAGQVVQLVSVRRDDRPVTFGYLQDDNSVQFWALTKSMRGLAAGINWGKDESTVRSGLRVTIQVEPGAVGRFYSPWVDVKLEGNLARLTPQGHGSINGLRFDLPPGSYQVTPILVWRAHSAPPKDKPKDKLPQPQIVAVEEGRYTDVTVKYTKGL